jgi:hypothetical protein
MNPKVLIIAGMHRSGTSLVTQWLQRCGLSIGKTLFPADVGNLDGHFEDTDFLDIHRRFLKSRYCPDTGFIYDHIPALSHQEKKELKALITAKDQQHGQWGWKDPRTCLFLETYHELIPSACYLFIIRDFRATVNSMLAREYKVHIKKFNTKKGLSRLKWVLFKKKTIEEMYVLNAENFLRIWIHYYEQIIQAIRKLPRGRCFFVRFTSLIQDDTDTFDHLTNQWEFLLNHIPFNQVYKKELLSEVRDVEEYIADKTLIEKAKGLEKEFAHYLLKKLKG